ncbi:hypothetical protein DFH94DRAFT_135837 [Russula ochroleuca]|uniref:Uncharacterized protein n=1 Tax=Russula ochroleuca TaxID=152965 RepID=A0A9P5JSQ3_9AGAM|nr:hypothetical protein DFH94DRAFT_189938 [Russula ochroleuca]KAF8473619.1 hypothetical protein DFH94DRAFT_135837 [Russula ochroleuca]
MRQTLLRENVHVVHYIIESLNPASRSHGLTPAPAFSNPLAIRAGVQRGRRGKPSWAGGWDPTKNEYAISARTQIAVITSMDLFVVVIAEHT